MSGDYSEPAQCIYDDEDIRRELHGIQMLKTCDGCGQPMIVDWDSRKGVMCIKCGGLSDEFWDNRRGGG
jgi:hypothetical protein